MKNGLSSEGHRRQAEEEKGSIAFAIVTVSDTRTPETDRSGQAIRQMAEEGGHRVVAYRIVHDEPDQVAAALEAGCTRLYTEDLQHGQQVEQLTIQNPFEGS